MKKDTAGPDPLPSEAKEIWYQPESHRQEATVEGIAVPIVQPRPGEIIEGTLLAAKVSWEDKLYMVVKTPSGEVAVRTDVVPDADLPTPIRVRLKGVHIGSEHTQETPAWEVFSLYPLHGIVPLDEVWLPAEDQHLESRTLPADQWIEEIQSRLVSGFRAQLQIDQVEHDNLVAEHAKINPLAPNRLDADIALLLAKRLSFGPYEGAYVIVRRSAPDSENYRQAKAVLESLEQLARSPAHREHLRSTAAAILQEDTRLRSARTDAQVNVCMLQQSLDEATELIQRLKPYGNAKVTMAQSLIPELRQRLLPTFAAAEPPRIHVKRGPKIHS